MGVASLYGCRWMASGRSRGARSRGEARGAARGWGPTGEAQDRLSACVAAHVAAQILQRCWPAARAPERPDIVTRQPVEPLDSHGCLGPRRAGSGARRAGPGCRCEVWNSTSGKGCAVCPARGGGSSGRGGRRAAHWRKIRNGVKTKTAQHHLQPALMEGGCPRLLGSSADKCTNA